MKRCPECRRDYYDETLLYCLDDGTALLEGPASGEESATAVLFGVLPSGGPASEGMTRPHVHTTAEAEPQDGIGGSTERQSVSAHQAAKPLIASLVLVFVLVGAYFGYRYLSSDSNQI